MHIAITQKQGTNDLDFMAGDGILVVRKSVGESKQ
jgi:hypothetical protein